MDDEYSAQPGELGPLPIADSNSELQEKSIKALNALLKTTGDLILRDERTDDWGVDCSLEVRLSGFMTNFRAQVQLKASAEVSVLKDGFVFLPMNCDCSGKRIYRAERATFIVAAQLGSGSNQRTVGGERRPTS